MLLKPCGRESGKYQSTLVWLNEPFVVNQENNSLFVGYQVSNGLNDYHFALSPIISFDFKFSKSLQFIVRSPKTACGINASVNCLQGKKCPVIEDNTISNNSCKNSHVSDLQALAHTLAKLRGSKQSNGSTIMAYHNRYSELDTNSLYAGLPSAILAPPAPLPAPIPFPNHQLTNTLQPIAPSPAQGLHTTVPRSIVCTFCTY